MHRPKNSHHEMDFFHFWIPFVRIYQFHCNSHYGIFRPKLKNHRIKLFAHRFFSVSFGLLQLLGAYSYFNVAITTTLMRIEKYNVSPIFLGVNAARRAIPFEILLKRHTEQKLFDTLQCIDEIFANKLKHSVDYRVHYRRQMVKTWLFFIVLSVVIVFSFFINIPVHDSGTYFGFVKFLFMLILWRMRIFQCAFFINLLSDLLGELKIVMRRQQQRVKYNPIRWKDIQYCRRIYSKMLLLKTLIGDCFGYSLILFVADSAVKMINWAYWFYLNIESIKSNNLHIR